MPCPRRRLAGCKPLVSAASLAPLCCMLALAGCATTLDVRTLATARADQSAFELTGRDLAALRREAGQLCPQGGEILRQTARDQRLEAVDSRMARWVHFSSLWLTPPERDAQLLVLCHPVTDRQVLAAAPAGQLAALAPADAVASAPGSAAAPAVPLAPIGPVSVEW